MNDQLREEARRKLIDEKVGLISQDDLVNWANEKLLEIDFIKNNKPSAN